MTATPHADADHDRHPDADAHRDARRAPRRRRPRARRRRRSPPTPTPTRTADANRDLHDRDRHADTDGHRNADSHPDPDRHRDADRHRRRRPRRRRATRTADADPDRHRDAARHQDVLDRQRRQLQRRSAPARPAAAIRPARAASSSSPHRAGSAAAPTTPTGSMRPRRRRHPLAHRRAPSGRGQGRIEPRRAGRHRRQEGHQFCQWLGLLASSVRIPAFATVTDSFVDCDGGTRTNVTYSVDSNGTGAAVTASAHHRHLGGRRRSRGRRDHPDPHAELGDRRATAATATRSTGRPSPTNRSRSRPVRSRRSSRRCGRAAPAPQAGAAIRSTAPPGPATPAASASPSTASTSPSRSAARRTRRTSSASRTELRARGASCLVILPDATLEPHMALWLRRLGASGIVVRVFSARTPRSGFDEKTHELGNGSQRPSCASPARDTLRRCAG